MREVSIAEGKVLDAPEESQETLKLLLSQVRHISTTKICIFFFLFRSRSPHLLTQIQLGAAIQLGPAATTASRG